MAIDSAYAFELPKGGFQEQRDADAQGFSMKALAEALRNQASSPKTHCSAKLPDPELYDEALSSLKPFIAALDNKLEGNSDHFADDTAKVSTCTAPEGLQPVISTYFSPQLRALDPRKEAEGQEQAAKRSRHGLP